MTDADTDVDREWWKESVVYQIYPRSFNDSDGDGVGDIPGIIEKLDYLDELGVDIVWLNPVYESPNADNGYDIADYRSIMAEFGTMADWERLLDGLHDRGIRLIMDLVLNHTSDEHEWFQKSSRSRDDDYRDYYVWREGDPVETDTPHSPPERPPNDWESFFGGPAWTYDEGTGEWYLHLFDRKQPDLNWDNSDVRDEVFDMVEWWLEKGIDGFRMDVINLVSKADGLPDGEDDEAFLRGADKFVNGPHIHEYLGELNDRVLSNYDIMTVGEMVDLDIEEALSYTGPEGDGLDMVFHFDHMRVDFGSATRWAQSQWQMLDLKQTLTHWQNGLYPDGWNSLFLNNHDEPRMVSRFGDDEAYRRESAKLLATLTHTLRGTPYVYQGEELGMTNYPFTSLDEVRDVDTLQNVEEARKRGRFTTEQEILDLVRYRSRDNARTPMQWADRRNAGFTAGEPWIPINPNYTEINVEDEREDPDSVLNYYKDLIQVRKDNDVLIYGEYDLHLPMHRDLWVYTRTLGDDRALVALNFADEGVRFDPPNELVGEDAEILISNYDVDPDTVETTMFQPYEARVYELK